jgi:predicted lipoprotein with Yx(FWY)xxD motif
LNYTQPALQKIVLTTKRSFSLIQTIKTQKMRFKYILLPAFLLAIASSLNSCSKSSGGYGSSTPPPVTPVANSYQLKTDSHFGSYLADANGNPLYFFSLDANGTSACTGSCLTSWPVSYVAGPTLDNGLTASDFSVITRSDGSKQTTYKGYPLYTYSGDSPGNIGGDGLDNIWFVAKPDYTVMLSNIQLVGNDGVKYDSAYKPGLGITQYLTDDRGVTLYSFSFDKADSNTFTKSDFSNDNVFPIVQVTTTQNVPSILNKSMLGTISVFGKTQLTFKGWPVYRFGADSLVRGNTKGISIPTPGIWPIMNATSPSAP